MKKLAWVLVCVLLLSIVFMACASNDDTGAADTTASQATDAAETTAPAIDKNKIDDLGDHDFEGHNFTVYSPDPAGMTWIWCTLTSNESDGSTINDSIYESCLSLKSRFNIEITESYFEWSSSVTVLTNLVNAGDTTYDIITMVDRDAVKAAQEGMLFSMNDLPYINLEKDYWGMGLQDYITIKNNSYFSFADFNLSAYEFTCMVAFNKKIADMYQIEDMYKMVDDGKWTYDKFGELALLTTVDLNGDGVMDGTNDGWGYSSEYNQSVLPSFWVAAGMTSVEKDAEDIPSFKLQENEKFFNMFNRLFEMTYDANTVTFDAKFNDGRVFIYTVKTAVLNTLRDMEDDFGIIPHPKWNEAQDGYFARVEGSNFTVVPIINPDPERTSIIMEAWASLAHRILIPNYYEVLVESKYTRDEESIRMLEVIFNNRVYDLGDTLWCNEIRDGFLAGLFSNNKRDLASALAQRQSGIDAAIAKTITLFDSIG